MLVITRRAGERFRIVPSVIATVVSSGGGMVTLEIATRLPLIAVPERQILHQQPASPGFDPPAILVSRRLDDGVLIGADIEIKVVSAKNDVAKLGIKAPAGVQILREELYQRIERETQEAAKPSPTPVIPDDIQRRLKQRGNNDRKKDDGANGD